MFKKQFLFLLFVLLGYTLCKAQDVIASTAKIGQLSLHMSNADVEKLVKKPIPKSELAKCDTNYDYHIKLTIDSIDYEARFIHQIDTNYKPLPTYQIISIKCNSRKLKTKSGLTQGMNKFKAMEILDKAKVMYHYSKQLEYNSKTEKSDLLTERFYFYDNKTYDCLNIYLKDGIIESFELTEPLEGC